MDESQRFKLTANRWIVNARWYYLLAIVVICFLAKYREWQNFDFLKSTDLSLYAIFGLLWLANLCFFLWVRMIEIRQNASSLSFLSYAQVITEIVLLVLLIYVLGGVDGIMPVTLVVPIIESIILFGGFYPVILAVIAVVAVNLLLAVHSTNLLSWLSQPASALELNKEWAGALLAKTELISVIYLVIGFFSTFVSNLIHRREALLASHVMAEEVKVNELRNFNQELEASTRELAAKDLELSLANKRLASLEEAKSQFIAVTTHQLRTPLSAIKWTFEMMRSGQLGAITSEQKDFLAKGFISTERMISIVNDLLNTDQIEAKRSEYSFVPTALEELIDSVLFEFSNQAQSKKIKLDYMKSSKLLPVIELDPLKIRILMENLLDNAIKYTPPGGQITITVLDDKINSASSCVEIAITDSGIGISPEERGKVFTKFFRARNAIHVEPNGSGIGLYISRDIVEKHGGTIWFEDGKEGGTSFHFTLPLKQSAVSGV